MKTGEKPARTAEDRLVLERSRLVRIRFVGIFDTVGSLGVPAGLGRFLTRRKYAFHDTNLSGLVDVACHAVAIDEHRRQRHQLLDHRTSSPLRGDVRHSLVGDGARPGVDVVELPAPADMPGPLVDDVVAVTFTPPPEFGPGSY